MTQSIKPAARREQLVVQELNGEILIYDLKIDKVHSLNETAATVWQFCDGMKSIEEISCLMTQKFKKPISEGLVVLALDHLNRENLLLGYASTFSSLSRREAIKKIGLGATVALPLVSTLIAPTATMAQSGAAATCSIGTACTCSVANTINLTTGVNCRTLGGTPTGCGAALTCDCLVTSSTTNGACVGI